MPGAARCALAAAAAAAVLAPRPSLACVAEHCRASPSSQASPSAGTRGSVLLQKSKRQGVVVLGDELEREDWIWGSDEAAPAPAPAPNASNTTNASNMTLRKAAATHGLLVGASLAYSADEEYRAVAIEQYNLATAETSCTWASIRPLQGVHDFTACDATHSFAISEMNATWHGPALVCGKSNPQWLEALADPAEKRNALVEHVQHVIRHYRNATYSWDVVGEAVTDDGSATDPLKKTWSVGADTKDHTWYPDVPDYIDMAFMAARLAGGPSLKLLYSDYNAMSCAEGHWMKTKSDRVFALVEGMVNRSIPIDGVSVQMSVDLSWDEPSLYEGTRLNFKRYEALGLEVHVTDVDVSCEVWSEEVQAQQAEVYAKLLTLCLQSPACKSFSTRGFTDKASPLGSGKHPLPFDAEYRPKAALRRMVQVLLATSAAPAANATANASASNASSGNSSNASNTSNASE